MIKFKIPYNYSYSDELITILRKNHQIIDSIYFSFEHGSRPIKKLKENYEYHVDKLKKIKTDLGVKLNYVLNSVIPIQISEYEKNMLDTDLIDIITIARDDVLEQINLNNKKLLEISRFYNYISENNGTLKEKAKILTYGFEHEIPNVKKNGQVLSYIVNERCYPKCEFKIKHNTNVVERNLGLTNNKFSCPYKDNRNINTVETIETICDKFNIKLLKLCDRTMKDDELITLFNYWFEFANKKNIIRNN